MCTWAGDTQRFQTHMSRVQSVRLSLWQRFKLLMLFCIIKLPRFHLWTMPNTSIFKWRSDLAVTFKWEYWGIKYPWQDLVFRIHIPQDFPTWRSQHSTNRHVPETPYSPSLVFNLVSTASRFDRFYLWQEFHRILSLSVALSFIFTSGGNFTGFQA